MNLFAIVPFIYLSALFTIMVLGFHVYLQHRNDSVNGIFLILSFLIFVWNALGFLFLFPVAHAFQVLVPRLMMTMPFAIGMAGIHLAYCLTSSRLNSIYYVLMVIGFSAVIGTLFTEFLVMVVTVEPSGEKAVLGPGFKWVSLYPLSFAYLVYLVVRCLKRSTDPIEIHMYRAYIAGTITSCILGIIDIAIHVHPKYAEIPSLTPAFMAFASIFNFRAISYHNYMMVSVKEAARDILDEARSGIVFEDHKGRIIRINRAGDLILGCESGQLIGRSFNDFFKGEAFPDDMPPRECILQRTSDVRYVIVSRSRICKGKSHVGTVYILRDTTEEKRVEEMLQESRRNLEEKVRRRTDELNQAKEMESVGTLAGKIAHDFNNLLSCIFVFTDTAKDEIDKESPLQEDLDEVIIAAKRARTIVRELMAFCRRKEKQDEAVEMVGVVDAAASLVMHTLPPTIRVVTELSSDRIYARGDTAQINQVIMNLCTNAFQSMHRNEGTITLQLKRIVLDENLSGKYPSLVPGPYIHLRVQDTGRGMDKQTMSHIFEPFFTTRKAFGGTGLGLSTALGIVEAHDGVIQVESILGQGTTFDILLPEIGPETARALDSKHPPRKCRARVLVVDDERQINRAMRRMLEPLGYEVSTFSESLEAFEAFQANPDRFDILITDQTMPQMTGTRLAEEVLSLRPDMPVILMTGYTDSLMPQHAADLGIRRIVSKPIHKDALVALLEEFLKDKTTWQTEQCR
ncbi:MAG: response regulator [Myxococcota bacterium]|jgi:PAS domain S-box-containing protein|nr:response regulator [Myxococcota bacterium]